MTEKTTINLAAYAKAAGIQARALRQSFPREWKIACLEMLIKYKEQEQQRLGYKRLGWKYIRDQIMRPYDEHKSNGKILNPDARLTRQNLETWVTGSELSDDKFSFVDVFIKKLIRAGEGVNLQQSLKEKQDRHAMTTLSALYQTLSRDPREADTVAKVAGRFLYSEKVLYTWFKYVVLRIDYVESGIVKITCAYCPFDIHDSQTEDISTAIFYDGFLIPFHDYTAKPPKDKPYVQPHHIRCLFKLMRPEFKGDAMRGYAEGELVYELWAMPRDRYDLKIYSDHPNTILAPGHSSMTLHHRYFNVEAAGDSALDRFKREADGEEFPQDNDLLKKYINKLKFHNDQKNKDFLERVFSKCYKGYVF